MKIEEITIKNYRTLEDLRIPVTAYYTAICGKNNAGKSSLMDCIKGILGYQTTPFDVEFDFDVNFKEDFTKWKKEKNEPIVFKLKIRLFNETDTGLIKFISTFVKSESQTEIKEQDNYCLEISLSFESGKNKKKHIIKFDENKLEDYAAGEVLNKIRNSNVLIFHNSTEVTRNYGRYHGFFDDFSTSERDAIKRKRDVLSKEFKKVSERHKEDLTRLLGRLNEKYDINLTVPDLSFEKVPYEISLGERTFDIPLDNWGSGTKNRTLILKSLFNAKKFLESTDNAKKIAPVVLIEEPESFLHPSAQAEFGKLLQDLATEFQIQIIVTTHSPFLLSNIDVSANILLERSIKFRKPRETYRVDTTGKDWKKPFALALGIEGPEMDNVKNLFFSQSSSILLVEGDTDKEYFELLLNDSHGRHKLNFDGEIYSYNGFGTLNNTVMLKFIKEKYARLIITFDLDIFPQIKNTLDNLRLENERDYFKVGIDKPGKRSIEGLLPDNVFSKVWANNTELVRQSQSDKKEEAEDAKRQLKKLYLNEFKKTASPGQEYFSEFYKLTSKINKILRPE